MGGVCSRGFKDDDKKLRSADDDDDNKSRGFSGKLKSMRRRKTSDSYYSDNYGNESSKRKSFKPSENIYNFSGELRPMPPLRNDSTKVLLCFHISMNIVLSCETFILY